MWPPSSSIPPINFPLWWWLRSLRPCGSIKFPCIAGSQSIAGPGLVDGMRCVDTPTIIHAPLSNRIRTIPELFLSLHCTSLSYHILCYASKLTRFYGRSQLMLVMRRIHTPVGLIFLFQTEARFRVCRFASALIKWRVYKTYPLHATKRVFNTTRGGYTHNRYSLIVEFPWHKDRTLRFKIKFHVACWSRDWDGKRLRSR